MKKYLVITLLVFSSCKKDAIPVDMTLIESKGEIIFISRRIPNSADWQMFRMDADGVNQELVSNIIVRCAPPVLSNSGNKIAFTTYENYYYNLYVIDKDGTNLQWLTNAKQYCGSPAWSPNDNTIAFVKNDNSVGGSYNIYLINVNGSNEIKLTNENNNYSPQFGNGNTIIYTSSDNTFTGIYKMNSNGTGKRLLTPQNKSFGNPVVSPDGSKIAITSIDWNGSQIFVMNPDGRNLKQITFTVSPKRWPGNPADGNCDPVWSPNSSKIAYVSYENGSPDIFIINPNGTQNKRLTDTPLRDENPTWTKDGKYIIFSSNRNINVSSEIYIMKPDGQFQTPLTNYISDDVYPIHCRK